MRYRPIGLSLLVLLFLCLSGTLAVVAPVRAGAAIGVNTTDDELNDDGNCSLREAIRAANLDMPVDACPAGLGADTISLPSGIYTLTIAGANEDAALTGDLDITSALTIAGAASTIIDGGALDRVFHVSGATITVTISGLTIQNGLAASFLSSGGGLLNNGFLTLTDSALFDNTANFGGGGAANNGTLTLNGSTVVSNTVTSIAGVGGGIANYGLLIVANSLISRNTSSLGGGGVANNGTLTLSSSTVASNTVTSGVGGGIANNSLLTIAGSLVSDNVAGDDGGGLANNGTLTVTTTTIRGNTAGDDGGGLRNFHTLVMADSSVISNTAATYGGGLDNGSGSGITGTLTITGSTFSGNTSSADGGGLYNELGVLTLTNSTVSGNAANGGGGGLYNSSTLTLNNATLTGNTADYDQSNLGNGGGLYNSSGKAVNFQNTLIAGNIDANAATKNPDCSGALNSLDYNLIQDVTGCTITGATTSNKTGVSPSLGPLQDNGGPTLTHALLSGSPAIDAGSETGCTDQLGNGLTTDQRGFARAVDGGSGSARCDIGAYEFGAAAPPPTPYRIYLPLLRRGA